ncbi:MAG: sigma-70 family RNA polymerase sigma factor [Alphaproteobacteria bacterium]|nr:sigma-70 family RNA polymerase sigma factor [Alphaproteobacteria bacterium]
MAMTSELARYCATQASTIDEEAILRRFMPSVKASALHLKSRLPPNVDVEDLIQAGMMALLRVVRAGLDMVEFDRRTRRIVVNAMIDEARRTALPSTSIARRVWAAAAAMRAVQARIGRAAADEEVAAELGISVERYQRILTDAALVRLLPLDDARPEVDHAAQAEGDQERAIDRERIVASLSEAVSSLPERERLVLSLYYEHGLNMDEVGAVLTLDKSTVCRLHGRALLALRAHLAGWESAAHALIDLEGE